MGFHYKTSTGMGETETPLLRGHKQNLACTKTQEKGTVTPQNTESDLPASVGGFPVKVLVSSGSPQVQGHWQQQSWKVALGVSPLGGHH